MLTGICFHGEIRRNFANTSSHLKLCNDWISEEFDWYTKITLLLPVLTLKVLIAVHADNILYRKHFFFFNFSAKIRLDISCKHLQGIWCYLCLSVSIRVLDGISNLHLSFQVFANCVKAFQAGASMSFGHISCLWKTMKKKLHCHLLQFCLEL